MNNLLLTHPERYFHIGENRYFQVKKAVASVLDGDFTSKLDRIAVYKMILL